MDYQERIEKFLDQGMFYSKAEQKDACDFVNRVYEQMKRASWSGNNNFECSDNLQKYVEDKIASGEFTPVIREGFFDMIDTKDYYFVKGAAGNWIADFPFNVYALKEKHFTMAGITSPALEKRLRELVDIRKTFKSFEIVSRPKKFSLEAKVKQTINDWLDREKKDQATISDLSEIFGDLHISTNVHRCYYWGNKSYLRTFWYIGGRLTKFAVIQAAYFEAIKKGVIPKPDDFIL